MARQLIRICATCKREILREPLPPEYLETTLAKQSSGDMITHGICKNCAKQEDAMTKSADRTGAYAPGHRIPRPAAWDKEEA